MWNYRYNNLLIKEQDQLFIHKAELERLLHTKPKVQNKGPDLPYFLKEKLSKKEEGRTKEKNRLYINSVILSRLLKINKTSSPYSKSNSPKYCPAFDRKKHHFDMIESERNLKNSNNFLFKRLSREKSFYESEKFFKRNNFDKYIKSKIKRQHLDNPNLKFVSFSQFKKNIIKTFRTTRNYSIDEKMYQIPNQKKLFNFKSYQIGKKFDTCRDFTSINKSIKKKINSRNYLQYSTMFTSKYKSLSRSQSSIDFKNQMINFFIT